MKYDNYERNKFVSLKDNCILKWEEIYGSPIIGYDKKFWKHCKENDREKISSLKRCEKRKTVLMECDKKHIFCITPYMYFVEQRICPYCICKADRGALNIDETLYSFWNDDRFELDTISEYSKERFRFKCPFCNYKFEKTMFSMVNCSPKCTECKDGRKFGISDGSDESMVYLFKDRDKRH